MSLNNIERASIVAGVLAAFVTVIHFLSKKEVMTTPQTTEPYGEWEDSLGI